MEITTSSDLRLIVQASKGRDAALKKVVNRYAPLCYQYAALIAGDPGPAAGVVRWVFSLIRTKPSTIGDASRFNETLCRLMNQALHIEHPLASLDVPRNTEPYYMDPSPLKDPASAAHCVDSLISMDTEFKLAYAMTVVFGLTAAQAVRSLRCTSEQFDYALNECMRHIGSELHAKQIPAGDPLPVYRASRQALSRRFPLSLAQSDAIWDAVIATTTNVFRPPKKLLIITVTVGIVLFLFSFFFEHSPTRKWLPESISSRLPAISSFNKEPSDNEE